MATRQKGTIIVTGANGHLGSAIVRHIVSLPELQAYHSIFIVRDRSAANTKLTSALKAAGEKASYEVVSLDLASLANVRQVATAINGRISAGIIPQIRGLTWAEDGFDMAFVASYLGHWLLTVMLLQSMDLGAGPFITGENIDRIAFGTWSTREDDPSTRSGMRRYGAAKFCLVTMISELQRRLSLDPLLHRVARRIDWFGRNIVHGIIMPIMGYVMMWLYPESNGKMRTTARSARDVMLAVMDVSVAKAAYFDGTALAETALEAQDIRKREMIWRDSVRYTQLKEGETVLKNWK
ncbi:NAD(P)-binding protein [Hypoxylon fuscum]|nr:NAD(P)-binding protein [Hypoxylon fuscum]